MLEICEKCARRVELVVRGECGYMPWKVNVQKIETAVPKRHWTCSGYRPKRWKVSNETKL